MATKKKAASAASSAKGGSKQDSEATRQALEEAYNKLIGGFSGALEAFNRGELAEAKAAQWVGMVDPEATSYAYEVPGEEELGAGLAVSGFAAYIASGFTIPKCEESMREYARITIGGPDIDGLRQAVARQRGEAQREITGTVTLAGGGAAAGVRVHAETTDGTYLSRGITDAAGTYAVHVPDGMAVHLTAWRLIQHLSLCLFLWF